MGHFRRLHCSTFPRRTHATPSITYPPVFACGHLSSIHTSFPASPSIPLLKQASFAVSFLTFFSLSCLFPFQTLTGCADFGSLLFCTNPLPDFPPSQIQKDFGENAVRHQMATKTFQLVIYHILKMKKRHATSRLLSWYLNDDGQVILILKNYICCF